MLVGDCITIDSSVLTCLDFICMSNESGLSVGVLVENVKAARVEAVLLGIGFVLLGLGIRQWWAQHQLESQVEVIAGDDVVAQITVDVEGAVSQPGVYTVSSLARLGEVLDKAGGLSPDADVELIQKTMNLASRLQDGEKVYVPKRGTEGVGQSAKGGGLNTKSTLVNINTASISELDKLPGLGEARVQQIIDNRPYGKVDELVTNAKLPKSLVDKIRDQITVN
jgi:DNA uptake protein ComE-like DNA-binding protein